MRSKVYQDVIKALEHIIDKQGLGPGDRLPAEAELAETLGVGTRSIREAYTTLRTMGIVEIRHGKGIYLSNNSLDNFLESLSTSLKFTFIDTRSLLLELTYVRSLIECQLVYELACHRTPADIENLHSIVIDMEGSLQRNDLHEFNASDFAFHMYIVQKSSNRIIKSLYHHVYQLFNQSIEVTQHYGGGEDEALKQHWNIYSMIQERRPDDARHVMQLHLEQTRKTIESLKRERLGSDDIFNFNEG